MRRKQTKSLIVMELTRASKQVYGMSDGSKCCGELLGKVTAIVNRLSGQVSLKR